MTEAYVTRQETQSPLAARHQTIESLQERQPQGIIEKLIYKTEGLQRHTEANLLARNDDTLVPLVVAATTTTTNNAAELARQ